MDGRKILRSICNRELLVRELSLMQRVIYCICDSTSNTAAVSSQYSHSPTSSCAAPTTPSASGRPPRTAAFRPVRRNLVTDSGPCYVSFEWAKPTWSPARAICHAMNTSTMLLCRRPVGGHTSRIEEHFTTSLSAVTNTKKDSVALYTLRYLCTVLFLYRATDVLLARYCYRMSSVRPSVYPSVTLMYREHLGWTSSKLIARIISLGALHLGATTSAI